MPSPLTLPPASLTQALNAALNNDSSPYTVNDGETALHEAVSDDQQSIKLQTDANKMMNALQLESNLLAAFNQTAQKIIGNI
jgi:hypothetical protein